MHKYAIRRLVLMVPTVLGVTILIFGLMRLIPGDIVSLKVQTGQRPSAEEIARLEAELNIADPVPIQYIKWVGDALRGDLGNSFWTHEPILPLVIDALPITLQLLTMSIGFGIMIALPVGIISAVMRGSAPDLGLRIGVILGLAVPNFWLATLFLILAPRWFGWVQPITYTPISEDVIANLRLMAPGAIILGIAFAANIARMLRSQMLEVLRLDFVRTARAKGLAERRIIFAHVLRNALLPVITLIGIQIVTQVSGSVIIERVFGLPGLGRMMVDGIVQRDYPMVQAIVLVVAIMTVMVNLIIDLLYGLIDPRVKYA